MVRKPVAAIAIAALFVVCCAWPLSRSLAEPMVPSSDLSTSASTPAQPQEVSDALARFEAHDFDGALKLLKEAAKKNSDIPPAQVLIMQLYARANMAAMARNALEQAVIEDPTDPEAYVLIADLAVRDRRFVEAELVYQKAASVLSSFNKSAKRKNILQANIYGGLAQVAEFHDNWGEMKKQLEAWVKLDPNSVTALQRLAHCLVHQKDLAGALEQLKKAEKADPQSLVPEAILARLCEQAADHENAKKYMTAALATNPKDLKTRLSAAQWAFETGQLDEAQAQATAALKLDDKSLDAKVLRGEIARFQKDYPTAERYFEDAHLQAPDNSLITNNLALALVEQTDKSKKTQALAYAEANRRQYQDSPDVAATYGWVLYKRGNVEDAERVLRAVAGAAPLKADTAYYLARVDVDRNKEIEAKALLEGALKTTNPFAMRQEAKALLEQLKK
jgi:Tfp pilus assembly protein PilF